MPNFDKSKGFQLKSGNTPLFKHIGGAVKHLLSKNEMTEGPDGAHNTQMEVKRGKVNPDHAEKKHGKSPNTMYGKAPTKDYSVDKGSHDHPHTPAKHTRRRAGHMDTYGAGHTNADHPDYWKKGSTGESPKSKEVKADTKTKTKDSSKKGSTKDKGKSKNILEKAASELKGKFTAYKESQKKRAAAGPKPKAGDKKYKWSPSGGWKAGGEAKYKADLAAYNEKLKKK
tara:strand:+ start:334 stop:1014 length:681 start_codon:yes stop_codon:yes gene_type:complete